VNVLDENITRDQADLLQKWGVRCRSISRDLGAQGISDENIIPLLLRLKKPTLLTRDLDFFDQRLVHSSYALVWFDVDRAETAFFVRRFLRDPRFCKSSQRLGKVIHVNAGGIEYWSKAKKLIRLVWHLR
jgi:predicted nuclease of predicted toxin-antitoxin system